MKNEKILRAYEDAREEYAKLGKRFTKDKIWWKPSRAC